MSQEREQPMAGKKVSWSFLAIGPIVGFVALQVWLLADGYNGHCGLLDAGWECSKAEYLLYSVVNPLIAPILLIYSIGWLLLLGIAAFVIRLFRRRQSAAT